MSVDRFGMMLFKDAQPELQRKYPNALWFAVSTKGMTGAALEQREMAFVKMRQQMQIVFTRQEEEFDGQIVWVGEKSVFGGLL